MSRLLPVALALLLVPASTLAQDIAASPTYGDVSLTEGFRPDPHTTTLTAGGSIEVNKGACTYGYVADAPDVDLYYTTSGGSDLYIYAESDSDVTLLVNAPDGSWLCDDDGLGNRDPLIAIPNAADGLYDIWIGTYGDEMQAATLHISEIAPSGGGGSSADGIDIGAAPTYGDVNVSRGFGSNTTTLTAGGSFQPDFGSCTYGNVAGAPDVDLYYTTDGSGPLFISVESEGDTTLLVNMPDGSWVCDDDSGNGSNPLLIIPNAADGLYDIWVGTYGDAMQSATLTISESQ
ncbi:MAG: hypothetical protein AAF624_11950 [Bacteroidota bacterium]